MGKITRETLKGFIRSVEETQRDEMGCGECWELFDLLADQQANGVKPDAMTRQVEEHLRGCGQCREEYDTLALAMRAFKAQGPVDPTEIPDGSQDV